MHQTKNEMSVLPSQKKINLIFYGSFVKRVSVFGVVILPVQFNNSTQQQQQQQQQQFKVITDRKEQKSHRATQNEIQK